MLRVPGRLPGLYLIETDADGRAHVPLLARRRAGARPVRTAGLGPHRREHASARKLVYFSGITLSLYSNAGLGRFLAIARDWRASTARRSRSTAISGRAAGRAICRARARCSWKRSSASTSRCRPMTTRRCCGAIQSPEATVERLQAFGIGEIVVKNGPNSALVATGGQQRIRAGAGGRGAGRYHGGRRQLQRRLSRGAARGRESERRRRAGAPARGGSDPPSRRDHAAHRRAMH